MEGLTPFAFTSDVALFNRNIIISSNMKGYTNLR